MTPEQTIELAKQAGLSEGEIHDLWEELQRFYELARNQTLEEAALKAVATLPFHPDLGEVCAEAIRGLKS